MPAGRLCAGVVKLKWALPEEEPVRPSHDEREWAKSTGCGPPRETMYMTSLTTRLSGLKNDAKNQHSSKTFRKPGPK